MRHDVILDHSWRSLVVGAVAAQEFARRPQRLDHGRRVKFSLDVYSRLPNTKLPEW